jgi:hypothetical protein
MRWLGKSSGVGTTFLLSLLATGCSLVNLFSRTARLHRRFQQAASLRGQAVTALLASADWAALADSAAAPKVLGECNT